MASDMFYGAVPDIFVKASLLRKNMTEAERLLWQELRNRNIFKVKFRRQHPIYRFIADFYCHEHKLVIEVDGEIHLKRDRREYDEGRTQEIKDLGIKILRFTNTEVFKNIDVVKQRILDEISMDPQPPKRGSRRGKEGLTNLN